MARWEEQGYLHLPNPFARDEIQRVATICEQALATWKGAEAPHLKDCTQNPAKVGNPDNLEFRNVHHPAFYRERPEDLTFLLDFIAQPLIRELVEGLFEAPSLFRGTTVWFNPESLHQDGNWHRDTQFLYPDLEEERREVENAPLTGPSVQLQIALAPSEDIEFVPGSHRRWDTAAEFQIRMGDAKTHCRSNSMPDAVRIRQARGDIAIFNPVGLHRGRYHNDKLRRVLMLTYTRADSPREDWFCHQPWFDIPGVLDGTRPETGAYFQRFFETYRDYWRRTSIPT